MNPHGSHSIGRLASFARLFTSSVPLRLQLGGLFLVVNYRRLPKALWTTIMPYFGAECSGGDRVAMTEARYDAKTPSFEFTPDAAGKQREATASTRSVADGRLGEIYRRLEALRLGA
jgi:hypothetical protein